MPTLEDVKNFFSTLILGEFEDKWRESTTAIIVRGLIGMIPGIDQVLDIQDTIGLIYRFEKKNWQLSTDDYADLAFTTIGWFPSLGSSVKAALKPIWKNRSDVARGVRNGVAMLERNLGYKLGAYIRTMRDYVKNIQKWNQAINNAIGKMREAINVYLQILRSVAKGSLTFRPIESWKWNHTIHFPNSLVNLAKQQIPATQKFQSIMADVVRQGSETVRLFLQELLGEHALLVATAVQGAASHTYKNQNYRPMAMAMANQRADKQRAKSGGSLGKSPQPTMQNGQPVQNVGTNRGKTIIVDQKIGVKDYLNVLGIMAEHVADYWIWDNYGSNSHIHDLGYYSQKYSKNGLYKVNHDGKLGQLHQPKNNPTGIDSLWYIGSMKGQKIGNKVVNKDYCIVEAKSSNIKDNDGSKLDKLLKSNKQMSTKWCDNGLERLGRADIQGEYARRVVFFSHHDMQKHVAAYAEVVRIIVDNQGKEALQKVSTKHQHHQPSKIYYDEDIAQRWKEQKSDQQSKSLPSNNKAPTKKKR